MSTMDNKRNYPDDLGGIANVSSDLRYNPFIVPSDYFSETEAKIKQRVRLISDMETSFNVPTGYFEALQERIFKRIELEEMEEEEEPSFIRQLKESVTESGFTLPETYFDHLDGQIGKQLSPDPSRGSIIQLKRPKAKLISWIQYAAAACVLVTLGIYGMVQYQSHSFDRKLEHLPENAIVEYLEYYSEPGDGAVIEAQFEDALPSDGSNLSDEEIQAYLENSI